MKSSVYSWYSRMWIEKWTLEINYNLMKNFWSFESSEDNFFIDLWLLITDVCKMCLDGLWSVSCRAYSCLRWRTELAHYFTKCRIKSDGHQCKAASDDTMKFPVLFSSILISFEKKRLFAATSTFLIFQEIIWYHCITFYFLKYQFFCLLDH